MPDASAPVGGIHLSAARLAALLQVAGIQVPTSRRAELTGSVAAVLRAGASLSGLMSRWPELPPLGFATDRPSGVADGLASD